MYEPTPAERKFLTQLNAAAFAVHVASAGLGTALLGHGNPKVPCIAPFVNFQTSPGGSGELAIPAPKTIFKVGALTGLLLFAWLTAGFHVIYILQLHSARFRAYVERFLGGSGVNPVRWVEYAITAGIMASLANLNIGATDFYLFLKVLCSNAAVQMIGYVLELLNHRDPLHARVASILWNQATVLNLVNVAVLLTQIFGSKVHSSVFYYNVVPYSILFQTFGIVAWLNFKRKGLFASAVFTEAWYIGLSLGTKLAVFWLGFATWRGLEESRGFAPKTPGVSWDAVRYVASYGPLSAMAALAALQYRNATRPAPRAPQPESRKAHLRSSETMRFEL